MKLLFADFETFYSKEYTLRQMTPVEYIMDARFEAHGCAFIEGDNGTPYWIDGENLQAHFDSFDPSEITLVTHNALFDACICAWRYNFTPALCVDTLAVSRACLGHVLRRHSLAVVAEHLGLGAKGNTLINTMGWSREAIQADPVRYKEFVDYAFQDVILCKGIFDKLVRSGDYPVCELPVMDMVLRCATKPKLLLDSNALAVHLNSVQTEKNRLLAMAMLVGAEGKSDLMSNDKFAELLVTHGVTPPRKISKLTGNLTYAFAKTDKGMVDLEEHPDPGVQVLVAARVGHKSTLEESRTERMLSIANLQWPDGKPWIPIPLRNHAAHTHRLGGEWKLNFQNLPRKSPIRSALIAPPGYTVVVGDASQIEARGVACLSGQDDLAAQFARGEDVYCAFASEIFGKPISKADKAERFIGKTSILGLGYQSGASTLKNAIRVQSRMQLGEEMAVTDEDAQKYVDTYRAKYEQIPKAWRELGVKGINALRTGYVETKQFGDREPSLAKDYTFGPCVFEMGAIKLPNGLRLFYPDVRHSENQWVFGKGDAEEKIYGGKLLENITQALARIITMDAALRIEQRIGYELAMQVHDELAFVVPDEHVTDTVTIMREELARRPTWMPTWPLASEINTGKTYGDAK